MNGAHVMQFWTVPTPVGPFGVLAEEGTVHASGWSEDPGVLAAVIARAHRPGTIDAVADLGEISVRLRAYLDGDLTAVDPIPVQQHGGTFHTHAWEVLRAVPAGRTISYGEFATACGSARAVRAAAGACGRNAAALLVPCHRIRASTGALHGFRYGLAVKAWLLEHEGVAVSASRVAVA